MTPTENQEQAALFEWARLSEKRHPELKLLHAIPNGGLREARTAAILARTGVKSGVPDLCLPVARGGFHGLYIELKRLKGGMLSINQKTWLGLLAKEGYKAVMCRGWLEARDTILDYLEGV